MTGNRLLSPVLLVCALLLLLAAGLAVVVRPPEPGDLAEALAEGSRLRAEGDAEGARTAYQRAVVLARRVGDRNQEAVALTGVGDTYHPQRDEGLGLEHYRQALRLARGGQAEAIRGRIFFNSGVRASMREDLNGSRHQFEQGLAAARRAGDRRLEARTLHALGNIALRQMDFDRAWEMYSASLPLAREAGSDSAVALVLRGLGDILSARGRNAEALEYYQQSLPVTRKLKDDALLASLLNAIGVIYREQAVYGRAIAHFEEALRIGSDPAEIGYALNNLGIAYSQVGDERSLSCFVRALKQLEEAGDTYGILRVLNNLGHVHLGRGDHARALEHFTRARHMAEAQGDRVAVAEHWESIGAVREDQGRYDLADEAYRRSLTLAEAEGNPIAVGQALASQASLNFRQARYEAALGLAARAAANGEETGNREMLWNARTLAGRSLRALGRDEEARQAFAKAVATIEQVRGWTAPDVGRESFFWGRIAPYQEMVDLLASQGEAVESLAWAERAKGRALLDLTRAAAGPPLWKPASVRGLLARGETALLEYAVLDKATYLFVVTGNGGVSPAVHLHRIGIGREELAREVEDFRHKLAARDLAFRTPARRLYDLLVAPAGAHLAGKQALAVVPDHSLWELPFQALQPDDESFLVERHALSYAPSLTLLSVLATRRRVSTPPSLLAVGDPTLGAGAQSFAATLRSEPLGRLPEAEQEVRQLALLYGPRRSAVYTAGQASEARIKAEAGRYRVLHFATHGLLDDRNPLDSSLVLAQPRPGEKEDGRLAAREILQLRLHADLVVLSACQTGRGSIRPGEGMVGMTWALAAAGSPATVASQWEVDSASTSLLMVELHRRLLAGATKAEALRQAALAVRRQERYRHPFYWAGFVLVGEG